MDEPFLDTQRLLRGPWQAFERDISRLRVCNGFEDDRLIGGSVDMGVDVLRVKNCQLWVIQCKFTLNGYPSIAAFDQVDKAAHFYKVDRIFVAASRLAGCAMIDSTRRWVALGIEIGVLEPSSLLEMAGRPPEYTPN